jgi:hypothetical protein
MIRVNVGLSRKLSRDYNSTGFSLNLEGELCGSPDDPEALIEKIKEFYDLAEEALVQQIDRYEGESAIGSRDEEHSQSRNGQNQRRQSSGADPGRQTSSPPPAGGNGHNGQSTGEAATNKQIQYLLNIGKRQGLTPQQLENRIEQIFSRAIGVYQLTKREAGEVIDVLTQNRNGNTERVRQGNGRN